MEKVEVTILEPEAEALLDEMAAKKLIKLKKSKQTNKRPNSRKGKDRLQFYLSAPVMSDEEYESYKRSREWMNQWRTI